MNFKKTSLAIALIIASSHIQAQEINRTKNQELVGFGSGAAIGAVVAGPVGAMVGAIIGSVTGNELDKKKVEHQQLAQLTQDYNSMQKALAVSEHHRKDTKDLLQAHQMFVQKVVSELSIDLLFRSNSSQIENIHETKINPIVSLMKAFPELKIQLQGYADVQGKDTDNIKLSHQRAETVKELLVKKGVDSSRIKIEALGESMATASATDNDGKALDRHVLIGFSSIPANQTAAID